MSLNAAIATTRFGLGAARGEIEVAQGDPAAWLKAQLRPGAAPSFPAEEMQGSKALITDLQGYFETRRGAEPRFREDLAQDFQRNLRRTLITEITARTLYGATTPASFHERLVRFWANHFTVSGRSAQTALVAGAYEREAIRPNIHGRFADLAEAAIFHPAMLAYLDNWQSVGPTSRVGRRRDRGLNENLAREVLELHTVTPAAGYSQADVTEFAKALTGWTVGNPRIGQDRRGETVFAGMIHEPGTRTVLGRSYRQPDGEQARAILRDLCARPETARNVAVKLSRHIVADTPPAALVDRLERVFLDTDGALDALYEALVTAPEAWSPEAMKVKTPDELLTSTARMMEVRAVFAGDPRGVFESFAQPPFLAPSPEGWPDTAEAWMGPDALTKRIEWAGQVALRAGTQVDARDWLVEAIGARASADTLTAIGRAESGTQALTLALMSPDFQRR